MRSAGPKAIDGLGEIGILNTRQGKIHYTMQLEVVRREIG